MIALQVKWTRVRNVRLKGPVGVFLKEFVENDVPWVHFDIACTAWGEKEKPYGPATGNVIRLVLDLLET